MEGTKANLFIGLTNVTNMTIVKLIPARGGRIFLQALKLPVPPKEKKIKETIELLDNMACVVARINDMSFSDSLEVWDYTDSYPSKNNK